jgi:hypothetical protein
MPVVGKFGFADLSLGEPGTDPVGGAYLHNQSRCIRVRIVVVLRDVEIILDIEIP